MKCSNIDANRVNQWREIYVCALLAASVVQYIWNELVLHHGGSSSIYEAIASAHVCSLKDKSISSISHTSDNNANSFLARAAYLRSGRAACSPLPVPQG